MPYLLDTNAVVALMKKHPLVMGHVRRVGRKELLLCAPVEAEEGGFSLNASHFN